MTIEKRLSEKSYNEQLLAEYKQSNPVEALGEMFVAENKKELADLSHIRFAQGEVYFGFQDYEAAIFKWENISNELEPWAKKNVGDAYFELGLLPTSIDFYKSIQTDSLVLQTEIALKLFEVYIAQGKQDLAVASIKQAVEINPDYQTITEIARVFFEQSNDWANAVELAVNESIRTELEYWFDILKEYIDNGHTQVIEPNYFTNVLEVIYKNDGIRFEKIVASLWKNYEQDQDFLSWMNMVNGLLKKIDVQESSSWHIISRLFQEAFVRMVDGHYKLPTITSLMPSLLVNWTNIVQPAQALAAYSALIAWNDFYPGVIKEETVRSVENKIWRCTDQKNLLADSLQLFDSIKQWTSEHKMDIGTKMRWFVQEILDLQKQNVVVVGVNGTGKTAFINAILGHSLSDKPTKNAMRIKNANESHVTMVSSIDIHSELEVSEVINSDNDVNSDIIFDYALPSAILEDYQITLIDTPGFRGRRDDGQVMEMLPLADQLLFVLDADDPFTEQERDLLLRMKEQAPHLPVTFVVTKLDTIYNKQEAKKTVEDAYDRIVKYEPTANVIAFSSKYEIPGQEEAILELFLSFKNESNQEKKRTNQLLQVIRRTISLLYNKRIEKEKSYTDAIQWNEEMVTRLNDSINELEEYKKDKTANIRRAYSNIKDDVKENMEKRIPEILQECAELLSEESDFRKIHLELNEEMNNRIQDYVENLLMPEMVDSLHEWIHLSTEELLESKNYLDEMSQSYNDIYGDVRIVLLGDSKILDDWQRDIRRMTSNVVIEQENILLRHTPSQFLLKSAGKLFGALTQNKSMLYNQYKKFVENEDYAETTTAVVSKFILQFDIFEKAIERDLELFFNQPFDELEQAVKESHADIELKEEALRVMKENPEIFDDAMTLFKIRLCQYEWMTNVGIDRPVVNL
ncbi:GTP-binding protein [Bacillus massiliigorillae]|uniref:GTP-binding protein n=1 Tax=Bacillus massiliigorillae TaxID=1243664 RepID=UPI0003AAB1C8|nr:GTP-binding protein [Bacillus massiliigorillae]